MGLNQIELLPIEDTKRKRISFIGVSRLLLIINIFQRLCANCVQGVSACKKTLPQIVSRSKHIILKHWSKWNEQQKTRAAILFDKFPKLLEGYSLSMKLTDIFNKKSGPDEARLNLARWYNEVEKFDYMEFNKVLDTFSNHSTTIINYFEERLTNASAESFNAKIKAFRSQLRGVADLKFFMFRLARLYA